MKYVLVIPCIAITILALSMGIFIAARFIKTRDYGELVFAAMFFFIGVPMGIGLIMAALSMP